MPTLLLIEDDLRLARMVSDYLRDNKFDVVHAANGASGLNMLTRNPVDLVILDLMLPDTNGLDLLPKIRLVDANAATVPVIMLTARGDPMDRVVGLEIGADDYLAKPFEPRELLARIRAVLRRGRQARGSAREDILRFPGLEIDKGTRQVRVNGEIKGLTSYQFNLLAILAERAGRVLSREQLADLAGRHSEPYDPTLDRSVDVHIARIRAVIEDDAKHPRHIITVRGAGYVFAKGRD
jgi:DNA-binding response OmpR family regulator